jgi:tetratricopeptide (TPR) repeat protein
MFEIDSNQNNLNPSPEVEFLKLLSPLMRRSCAHAAAEFITQHWPTAELCTFASSRDIEISALAIDALALCGDKSAIVKLQCLLRKPRPDIHRRAENALWSIWFRSGSPQAVCHLKCGSKHLEHENYLTAVNQFSLAFDADPTFAEALNQRAIAYYLSGRYREAIDDCLRVVALMPPHFGALAGMGHCHAQQGQFQAARSAYCRALAIYPYMDGVRQSLSDVEALIHRQKPAA